MLSSGEGGNVIHYEQKMAQEFGEPTRLTRAVCSCGWKGVWFASERFATISGDSHDQRCPEGQRKESA